MSLPATPGQILALVILWGLSVVSGLSVSSQPNPSIPIPQPPQFSSQVPISNQNATVDDSPPSRSPLSENDKPNTAATTPRDKTEIKVEEILQEIFAAEFEDGGLEMQKDAGSAVPEVTSAGPNNVTDGIPEQRQSRLMKSDGRNRDGRRPARRQQQFRQQQQQQQRRNENRKRQNQNARQKLNGGNNGFKNKRKGPYKNGLTGGGQGKRKALDLAKYNAYMDAVLSRMNGLIRKKRMDPLRVNLYAGGGGGGQGAQNKNKRGQGKGQGKTKKKGSARWEDEDHSGSEPSSDDDEEEDDESGEVDEEGRSIREVTLIRSSPFQRGMRALAGNGTDEEERGVPSGAESKVPDAEEETDDEGRGKVKSSKPERKVNKGQSVKRPTTASASEEDELPAPPPPKKRNSPRPTRGVLHGLSSLRREGNVQVIKDGEKARIIRSKFLLGPVALEILPKKMKKKSSRENSEGPGSPPSPPTATATAPELKGILEIRLSPGKPTRIRKLRVFPPGNIQVDGDKKSGNQGMKRAGYRKVTPMATARLRQTAVQVLRQVDNRMKNGGRLRHGQEEES